MIRWTLHVQRLVMVLGLLVGMSPTVWSASPSTVITQEQQSRIETRHEQHLEEAEDRTDLFQPSTFQPTTKASPEQTEQVRSRKWNVKTRWSWTAADETNPNLSQAHQSALSTEEYAGFTFSYRLHPQLTWETGYSGNALNYNEFTDLSTFTNSLTTKLSWRMAPPLRIEARYTFEDTSYPYDREASTWAQTVHVRVRHDFLTRYYHAIGWSYLNRQYQDQATLDSHDDAIPGKYRKDQRHAGLYELGGTVGEHTTCKIRQKVSFHQSNAAFQDFYDAVDYQVKLIGRHEWTAYWSSVGSVLYELKRYAGRQLPDRAVVERDHAMTYQLGLTYRLSPDVSLAYTWQYVRQRSNEPTETFGDITNSLALTAAF